MSNKFNVGDMVIMTREPTDAEWAEVGKVEVPQEYYEKPHQVVRLSSRVDAIELTRNHNVYPSCCFELAHEHAAEQYKKDVQKESLLRDAAQKFSPKTRFKNRYGSTSTVSDNPQYKYDDGYIYVKCVTDKYVCIYDKLSGWADIISSCPVQAKEGDYIKILHHNGYSSIKGETFYVVSVTDNQDFSLAKPGTGDVATIRWACSDPSCYEICDTVQVVNEYKAKEYSEGIISCESPIVYNVGDTVIGLPSADGRYAHTKQGWEGVITRINDGGESFNAVSVETDDIFHELEFQHFTLKASKSDGPRYKVDLPTFDHRTIRERVDYLTKKINQHNGTESNKSVKLQGVNLKIREGNPIRGIGLKSSRSKIKLRSYHRYN